MLVEDLLREHKLAVEEELGRILARRESLLYQAMRYAVFGGGKRYRPLLLTSAGTALGGGLPQLLPFACALELIHCYSLVHDDLPAMDDDDFRRGRPSCHKAFGEGLAILAGDALLTLAFEVMAAAPLSPALADRRALVMDEVARRAGAEGMIDGQALDIRPVPEGAGEESLLELVEKKTGGLIIASVTAGAILGSASPEQTAALEEYGRHVGTAFQVRDDLLDAGGGPSAGGRRDLRPSFVSFFGEEESRRRLRRHVQSAVAALAGVSLVSEALVHLATRLLDPSEG